MREVINFIQVSVFCEWLSQISSSEISKTHCLGLGLYVSNVNVYGRNAAHEDGCMKLIAQQFHKCVM